MESSSKNQGLPQSIPHILVADDEYSLHTLFRAFLNRIQCNATIVDSGVAALAAVRDSPQLFQCALLDIMMPKMNGIEAAQHIHQLKPSLPIVLMTGWTQYPLPPDLPLAGFLSKPFTFGEFAELMKNVVATSTVIE